MELRHLRYFLVAAEYGHITRAAERLHITQPALSQAVKQLELDIGVELLARNARGVALTPAGEEFLPHATTVLQQANEARQAARKAAAGVGGELRLGFLPGSDGQIQLLLDAFRDARPNVRIRMKLVTFVDQIEALRRNTVDAMLAGLPIEEPDINYLETGRVPQVVAISQRHPLAGARQLSVQDLLEQPAPGFHPAIPQAFIKFHTMQRHRGEPPAFTDDEITGPEEAAAVVAHSGAVMLAPAAYADQHRPPGMVFRPVVDADPFCQAITYLHGERNPILTALLELIQRSPSLTNRSNSSATTQHAAAHR